jgi:drug/metabolite transporter (DMT)-like permease
VNYSEDQKNTADPLQPTAGRRWRIGGCLAVLYVLWGTSYLAIKQAGSEIPPGLLVGLRNLAGGLLLMALVALRGRPLGTPRQWFHAGVVGVLMISVGASLLAGGMQTVDSGLAAVVFAAVPLVVCVSLPLLGRRVSVLQGVGTLMGLAGLLWLQQLPVGSASQVGLWLIAAAVIATAASAVLADRLSLPQDLLVSAGVQMMAGGACATLVGWLRQEKLSMPSAQALAAWAYLAVVVSVLGYLAYTYLLSKVGPVVASSYAYVNPPVALLAGAWLLDEHISGTMMLATGVVLLGALTVLHGDFHRSTPHPG